jgi:hypothetical protein
VKTQSWDPMWDFAKHRKGLFFGVASLAMPALVVFRFPHVAALVVRGIAVVGTGEGHNFNNWRFYWFISIS